MSSILFKIQGQDKTKVQLCQATLKDAKKVVIRSSVSKPKQIPIIPPENDDSSILSRHSKFSTIVTLEQYLPISSTSTIVSLQTDNKAVLSRMPKLISKTEYEGS